MKCLQRGILIVVSGGLLLACGQKGALLLPDGPKHKRSGAPLASPVTPGKSAAPGVASPSGESPAPSASPPAPSPSAPASPASTPPQRAR